jgi:hypothetical protein
VRASLQPLALQERLQSICCRHDHVGAPHDRLNPPPRLQLSQWIEKNIGLAEGVNAPTPP